jgi:outer membrane receptor protein involved in Fe transport
MKGLCIAALALPGLAWAQEQPQSFVEEEVVVTAPLSGSELPLERVPTWTQVVRAQDFPQGAGGMLSAMENRVAGVSMSQAQDNPFQPNLVFRGFQASPLQGNSQGLAVYINGARFNQPFGDTVDWDLIPDQAVRTLTVEGSAPAFGLNALGGAVAVQLKTGFSDPSSELSASGGSFGRWDVEAQHGSADQGRSVFLSLTASHDDGWRKFSPSDVRQGYLDLGWRGPRSEVHFSLLAADNSLTGNGPTPIELLKAAPTAVFTYPDLTKNRNVRTQFSYKTDLGGSWSVSAVAYAAWLQQKSLNADVSDASACKRPQFLCFNFEPMFDVNGNRVMNVLLLNNQQGFYSQLNDTKTAGKAFGASAQISNNMRVVGRSNDVTLGASVDGGLTHFMAQSTLGLMTPDRGFTDPIAVISQPNLQVAPVSVIASSAYYGVYAQDVIQLNRRLSLDLSARGNYAILNLQDLLRTSLNGHHTYGRVNPAAALSYRLLPDATVYFGYVQANRTPTPAELSCAGHRDPCSLTNFFVGDPNLFQVVSYTYSSGIKGRVQMPGELSLSWNLDAYHTSIHHEIILVASGLSGRAFFRNVAATRRQGVTANFTVENDKLAVWIAYAYTDARFETSQTLNSQDNPGADANGLIQVQPGNRMPGVPAHQLKVGFDYDLTSHLHVGANGLISGGQVLFGDEANLTPKTPAYALFGVNAAYRIHKWAEVFGEITNLTDIRYATFGTFCPTDQAPYPEAPNITNTRCYSPGPPRAFRVGLKLSH